jgi:hypothetical protein
MPYTKDIKIRFFSDCAICPEELVGSCGAYLPIGIYLTIGRKPAIKLLF